MESIISNIKKIVLFLFGIVLIVWGYKVNAANVENNKAKDSEKDNKNSVEEKGPQKPMVRTLSKEDVDKAKKGETTDIKSSSQPKPEIVKSTVETDQAEESSGTN